MEKKKKKNCVYGDDSKKGTACLLLVIIAVFIFTTKIFSWFSGEHVVFLLFLGVHMRNLKKIFKNQDCF